MSTWPHGLPVELEVTYLLKAEVKGVGTREETVNWIINHQLGRRSPSGEQKSYLWGKRYNLERQAIPNRKGNNQHREVEDHSDLQPTTAGRLAQEYQVGEATIRRDGQFAKAVDTLAEALGPEVRQEVLAGDTKIPERQVVKSAQAVRQIKRRLQPKDFRFMRGLPRGFHQDALRLLAELPADEHALVDALLDQPGLPAREMLEVILRRFPARPLDARHAIYALDASEDPRDRARALREAAGGTPVPPLLLRFLDRVKADLQRTMKHIDQCVQLDPTALWVAPLQALRQIQALRRGKLAQMQAEVQAYFEADPEAIVPADEIVGEAEDRDGTVDHSMPEVEVPAEETVDEANNRDDAVDQDFPELEVEQESAAASNLTTSLDPVLDSESLASANLEDGAPTGWCGSTRTWRAEASGRIYCRDCHAVYNPAANAWDPGERAK